MSNSSYEYKPGQIDEFIAWLTNAKAELKPLTNDWEVVRWRANGVTGVIYTNKHGILSFSNAAANGVWKMFLKGHVWVNFGEPKPAPAPVEVVVKNHEGEAWTPPWDPDPSPEVTSNRSIDRDEAYMQMAEVWAKRSHANRLQVGALIVKDKQIISDGYNGMPAGAVDEVCETDGAEGVLETKPDVLHAESNAISKLARHGGMGALSAVLYVTHAPCLQCAKLIVQSGITLVYYRNTYRSEEGLEMLHKNRVTTIHLKETS